MRLVLNTPLLREVRQCGSSLRQLLLPWWQLLSSDIQYYSHQPYMGKSADILAQATPLRNLIFSHEIDQAAAESMHELPVHVHEHHP